MDLSSYEFGDLSPRERVFRGLRGDDYVMTEMSAGAAARYENRKFEDATYGEDGTLIKLGNHGNLRLFGVALCLSRTHRPPEQNGRASDEQILARPREPVTEEFVRDLLHREADPLIEAATDLNPDVMGRPSAESLLRQRARIDKALAVLERGKNDPKG